MNYISKKHGLSEMRYNNSVKIPDLIRANKRLAKALRKAEKADKNKAYFWAQASHDLRQPMQALRLYLDIFYRDNLNNKQLNILNKICKTADNLENLLNNFLDLSKLDYGAVKVSHDLFNIGILLSNIGSEFADIANGRNLILEYHICNCCIYGDTFLVERLIRNLLSNAIKFAHRKVQVDCEEFPRHIKISIKDDGNGISLEEQKHIFKEFYRGKDSYLRNIDGAGLGLSIVKRIAQLLKIKISVISNENDGSTFSFILRKSVSFNARVRE